MKTLIGIVLAILALGVPAGASTVTDASPEPGTVLVHKIDGTHLSTTLVNETTGKVLAGPIRVTGKKKWVGIEQAPSLVVGCYLYVYPPFTVNYIVLWMDAFAEIGSCFPTTGFNMILGQQLYQATTRFGWYKVGSLETSGGAGGLWSDDVNTICYSAAGPWASKQWAQALIEYGGSYGGAESFSPGDFLECNGV